MAECDHDWAIVDAFWNPSSDTRVRVTIFKCLKCGKEDEDWEDDEGGI